MQPAITLIDPHGTKVQVHLEQYQSDEKQDWNLPRISMLLIADVTPNHPRADGLQYDPAKVTLVEGIQIGTAHSEHCLLALLQHKLERQFGMGNVRVEVPSAMAPVIALASRRMNGQFPYHVSCHLGGMKQTAGHFFDAVQQALQEIKAEMVRPQAGHT